MALTRTGFLVQWIQEKIGEHLKMLSRDSYNHVVAEIFIRESRVIRLWLEECEVFEVFLFLGGWIYNLFEVDGNYGVQIKTREGTVAGMKSFE